MSFSRCWVNRGLFTSSCWGAGKLPGTQEHFHIQSSILVMLAARGVEKAGFCQVACVLLGSERRISVAKAAWAFSGVETAWQQFCMGLSPASALALSQVPQEKCAWFSGSGQTGLRRALWQHSRSSDRGASEECVITRYSLSPIWAYCNSCFMANVGSPSPRDRDIPDLISYSRKHFDWRMLTRSKNHREGDSLNYPWKFCKFSIDFLPEVCHLPEDCFQEKDLG